MSVNRGKRAAVGGGPYGGVRNVSIIVGRAAVGGGPYGVLLHDPVKLEYHVADLQTFFKKLWKSSLR